MGVFTMVTIIVVAAVLAEAYKVHRKTNDSGHAKEISSLQNEVEALRERVKSLETIVTDQSYSVRNEIDGLRTR